MHLVGLRTLAGVAVLALLCRGQSSPTQTITLDQTPVFRAESTLVSVPVVVRDARGRPVAGLRQQDFELFDRGKSQVITRFSIERTEPAANLTPPNFAADRAGTASDRPINPSAAAPERFVAFVFDDVHLRVGDLARAREAALRQISTALGPTDRVAIFPTSSEGSLEFTNDRDALRETLRHLLPRPIGHAGVSECPEISYYVADRIINHDDSEALNVVIGELNRCGQGGPGVAQVATALARVALSNGARETRASLAALRAAVQRISMAPGQRVLMLVSPGFYAPEDPQQQNEILERAIRAKVVINALDPRGVVVDSAYDASRGSPATPSVDARRRSFEMLTTSADNEILTDMTSGSGGSFFRGRNDLDAGFKTLTSTPGIIYVLGFSPQNLKLDGVFHTLKVSVKGGGTVEARRGYYAPRAEGDDSGTAAREIEESVFSNEEVQEIPISLQTQFAKLEPSKARITVLARIDVRYLRYRKEADRNRNALTIVTALFDQMGKYVAGNQKSVDLRMKEESLSASTPANFDARSVFDMKPGVYRVRVVVRDAEGRQMSAVNGSLDVPLI